MGGKWSVLSILEDIDDLVRSRVVGIKLPSTAVQPNGCQQYL